MYCNSRFSLKSNFCSPLLLIFLSSSCFISKGYTADYFDPNMLRIGNDDSTVYNNEDLSLFNEIDSLPGEYQLDLYINNNKIEHRKIYLYAASNQQGKQQLTPCLAQDELQHYGIELPSPIQLFQAENGQQCVDFTAMDYAKSTLDLNKGNILLQVPQAYIHADRIQFFERQYWDDGIPVFRLDYNLSEFSQRQNSKTENSTFAHLRSSANYGAWRFNQNATWRKNTDGKSQWKTLSNTLSRNIPALASETILGDSYTSSALFDGIKIRGAVLQSDRMMLTRQNNAYAPGISGIADSESIVTIIQNGNVIYRKAVTAGPFHLTDYYPITNGGNMTVEVESIDGQIKRQIVPFSSLDFLERKNNFKYHIAVGKSHGSQQHDAWLTQAEVTYGLTDYITLAAGSQLSEHYKAFSLGPGFNLGRLGAASINVIHALSEFKDDTTNNYDQSNTRGNAFKLNYSKTFTPTNTAVNFAGYKHFSSGYYNLNEVLNSNARLSPTADRDSVLDLNRQLKHQFDFTLTQTLPGNWGALSLNTSLYDYRQQNNLRSYNLSYNLSRRGINYGIYYNYYNDHQQDDQHNGKYSFNFSVSLPLSFSQKPAYASYSVGRNVDGQNNQTIQLNGLAGQRAQASWNVYQGYEDKNYGGFSSHYNAPFASLNAGYSYRANHQHNINAGIEGTFVATQYGALLSQPLQTTNALILAKDIQGIELNNATSAKTNKAGLTLLPGLSAYRHNQISLNTQSIPENTEIEETIINRVIPTKGALILANFNAKQGYKMLVTLQPDHVQQIPMGAQVSLNNQAITMVANFNQAYVLVDQIQGDLDVHWQFQGQTQYCRSHFDLNSVQPVHGLYIMQLPCTASAETASHALPLTNHSREEQH